MNKIQELAEKAKKSVPHGLGVDKWIETYNEIFANLIIEECGRALNPMLRDMISRGQGMDLIKEHFKISE
jgi:hypothetical protein